MSRYNLFTFELEPGMITAQDVFTPTGQLLVPDNTILNNITINKLKLYNISNVAIREEAPPPAPQPTPDSSYSEKIKSSEEFKKFKELYTDNIDRFHNTINEIVTKNEPINPTTLLKQTASILSTSSTTLHIFDMLHNMREFDDSTYAHCLNVSLICGVIGKWLHMSQEDINMLSLCGMLHDIGKLTTPEHILMKPGKLTNDEYAIMKQHVKEGYNYLKTQKIDARVKEACLFHHERCDGSGYPYGLTGDKIPEFAKIVSIADVYDAMTARRVYRGPVCPFKVIRVFEDEGYSKYDPKYLLPFLENVVASYMNNTVSLSNGELGEIIMINQHYLSRPVVRCQNNKFIDLSQNGDIEILEIV